MHASLLESALLAAQMPPIGSWQGSCTKLHATQRSCCSNNADSMVSAIDLTGLLHVTVVHVSVVSARW